VTLAGGIAGSLMKDNSFIKNINFTHETWIDRAAVYSVLRQKQRQFEHEIHAK
jgi:hypothetical protein